jgi:hypothetical protein
MINITFLVVSASFSTACLSRPPQSPPTQPVAANTPQSTGKYVLPKEVSFQVSAERGPDGRVFITGVTNLPNGLKFGVEIPDKKWEETITTDQGRRKVVTKWTQQTDVVVQDGRFRSDGFLLNQNPYPAGQFSVQFYAYFDGASQDKEILDIIGYGGKNLSGKIFKKEDPDVVDSDLVLDYAVKLDFPVLSPEASELAKKAREAEAINSARKSRESEAIDLVKRSILNVQGYGRSYATVRETVDYYMSVPGMRHGRGWSAQEDNAETFVVTFDFIDTSAGPSQAVWSADLATRKVKYVNKLGKTFSWLPKE